MAKIITKTNNQIVDLTKSGVELPVIRNMIDQLINYNNRLESLMQDNSATDVLNNVPINQGEILSKFFKGELASTNMGCIV